MPKLTSPSGTVAHVGDGPLVDKLKTAGWTVEGDQPKPAKKTAPRKRAPKTDD